MAAKTATPRARDIMRTDVLALASGTTIQEAVETLEEYKISGAPVVDALGKPIGFLSKSDIARGDHVRRGRIEDEQRERVMAEAFEEALDSLDEEEMQDEAFYAREDYSGELLGRTTVDDWMRREVVTVSPNSTVREVCQQMIERSIHRLLVLEEGRILGIVTTTDVVRHVAKAD
jgi:CBS domain-containing protein